MTNKEIIKGLEICSKEDASCGKCPLFAKKGIRCICFLQKNALNLIDRLEAENDSLKYDMELLKQEKSYVEAEAIKEFVKRLKEKSSKMELVCSGSLVRRDYTIDEEIIDNLVKEMVGEG